MEPYKLMLELRENKILFSYMDTVAVYVEEDENWFIIGDSDKGELRINLTESNVLRLALPIPTPSNVPVVVLDEVLTKMESDFDGLLKAEVDPQFKDLILYYYIHVGVHNYEKDLSKALIRFSQDKRTITKVFSDLARSISSFKSNIINGLNKGPKAPSEKGPDLWNDLEKLDKQFNSNSEEDIDTEDDEDDIDSD